MIALLTFTGVGCCAFAISEPIGEESIVEMDKSRKPQVRAKNRVCQDRKDSRRASCRRSHLLDDIGAGGDAPTLNSFP